MIHVLLYRQIVLTLKVGFLWIKNTKIKSKWYPFFIQAL